MRKARALAAYVALCLDDDYDCIATSEIFRIVEA